MGDSSEMTSNLNGSSAIELTGKITMVALILLFLVVVFVLFLHFYARWFWYRQEEEALTTVTTRRRRRRRRFDFAPGHLESEVENGGLRHGLDPSVLKSLPVLIFNPEDFKDGLECAVCLSELAGGEKARLLPKCEHGFHVDCIDMWFQSHSTCPLCRNPVSTQSSSNTPESTILLHSPPTENQSLGVYSTESPNFPTNVLFWGGQTQVSTVGSCLEEDGQAANSSQPHCCSSSSSSPSNCSGEALVIDMPRQNAEDEEQKSPVTTRLRSLKRLLSRDRRVNPCGASVDSEQIGRGQS